MILCRMKHIIIIVILVNVLYNNFMLFATGKYDLTRVL